MADKKIMIPADKTEIIAKVAELKKELALQRAEKMAGKLKDVRAISKLRHQIAQLKTALRTKELEEV